LKYSITFLLVPTRYGQLLDRKMPQTISGSKMLRLLFGHFCQFFASERSTLSS